MLKQQAGPFDVHPQRILQPIDRRPHPAEMKDGSEILGQLQKNRPSPGRWRGS
jgi:hypothetical protein